MDDWREHGIKIVRAGCLDTNTAQTPGMNRAAAITLASAGARKLWAGTVVVEPGAKTGAHHHGEVETVLYIIGGRARFRWGNALEFVEEAGMNRAAAITLASAGARKLWAGTVVVEPGAKTGAHHHGEVETVLYIIGGRARFRWGNALEFVEEAGPGDFIFVPPWVPHQEINALRDQPCEAVVVRSGQDPVVVNLEIESPEDGVGDVPFHPRLGIFKSD